MEEVEIPQLYGGSYCCNVKKSFKHGVNHIYTYRENSRNIKNKKGRTFFFVFNRKLTCIKTVAIYSDTNFQRLLDTLA